MKRKLSTGNFCWAVLSLGKCNQLLDSMTDLNFKLQVVPEAKLMNKRKLWRKYPSLLFLAME